MIDWVQALLAGVGGGLGAVVSAGIRSCISRLDKRAHRVILILVVLVAYLALGVFLAGFFSENARIAAAARSFAMVGAISIVVSGSLRNKAKTDSAERREPSRTEASPSTPGPTVKPEYEPKKYLSCFGCFKADTDPRNMQAVGPQRNLYFFVDGILSVNDTQLVFTHEHPTRGDIFRRETNIWDIRDIEWYTYDENEHEAEGKEARYLVRGLWRLWAEVGYFWLPGGSATEMECTVSSYNGTESYFYFRGTPKNIKSISEIREHILMTKLTR